MKTLKTNLLGKFYLEQLPKITIKSLYKEIEDKVRDEVLNMKLEWIDIVYSDANYGGKRKWFKCPSCSQKVFTLYNFWWKLLCRTCTWLWYKSQKYSKMLEEKVYKMK